MFSRSHIDRGPVVCSAHECSQQVRWLLDWSRIEQCLLRSLENKCCGVARANTTLVQLWDLTYDRTNDISKGNLGTFDLDGAFRFTVVNALGLLIHILIRVCGGVSGQE